MQPTHRPDHPTSAQPPEAATAAAVFAGFRQTIAETAATPDRRIDLADLSLAIAGNFATFALCFAPWLTYVTYRPNDTAAQSNTDTGFVTDGWIVAVCAVVAVVSFLVASRRADQAMPATVGFVATLITFVAAGSTWMVIEMAAPNGAESVKAAWGVMACTGVALLATGFAFRVMRTARIY